MHISNCKGGKNLDRIIEPGLEKILVDTIKRNNISSGPIFNITENAVNTYLRRIEETLGIKGRFSIHNIRSACAQEKYDLLRQTLSSREAVKAVSLWLNHGENRYDLLKKSYIEIW